MGEISFLIRPILTVLAEQPADPGFFACNVQLFIEIKENMPVSWKICRFSLQKIKAKYDPDNFFRMNQNIKPAQAQQHCGFFNIWQIPENALRCLETQSLTIQVHEFYLCNRYIELTQEQIADIKIPA